MGEDPCNPDKLIRNVMIHLEKLGQRGNQMKDINKAREHEIMRRTNDSFLSRLNSFNRKKEEKEEKEKESRHR